MSDTTKHPENVIPRRRSDDWKKPLSVSKNNVFDWNEGDGVAFIDDKAMARVTAALAGARTIAAILMQRELDRNNEDDEKQLNLDEVTVCGLFGALASCIEVAEHHATEDGLWTIRLSEFDPAEAEHVRKAAREASITSGNRQAVEHVDLLNQCKAAKAAKKGAA